MGKFFKESALILLAFAVVFLWQATPLSQYTIHSLIALTLIYLLLTARHKDFNLVTRAGDSASVLILTVMILLLVISTGGLTSTLFFLLYFLSFGITFAFEPAAVFVFTLLATLFFLQSAVSDDVVSNFLHIGSLFLIAPFAFFFGRQIKADEKEQQRTQKKSKKRK